jgi:hypothetical protein
MKKTLKGIGIVGGVCGITGCYFAYRGLKCLDVGGEYRFLKSTYYGLRKDKSSPYIFLDELKAAHRIIRKHPDHSDTLSFCRVYNANKSSKALRRIGTHAFLMEKYTDRDLRDQLYNYEMREIPYCQIKECSYQYFNRFSYLIGRWICFFVIKKLIAAEEKLQNEENIPIVFLDNRKEKRVSVFIPFGKGEEEFKDAIAKIDE